MYKKSYILEDSYFLKLLMEAGAEIETMKKTTKKKEVS